MEIFSGLIFSILFSAIIMGIIYSIISLFEKHSNKKHMNKKEAQNRLSVIEKEVNQLREIISGPEISKEKEMSDFIFSMLKKTIHEITDEKGITLFRPEDNEWLVQLDYKNGYLWVRYSLIWKVFETKFSLNYNQIRDFIAGWVEANTEWRGLTPNQK
jgi:hypothetical protein